MQTIKKILPPPEVISLLFLLFILVVILPRWFTGEFIITSSEERFIFNNHINLHSKFTTPWIPAEFGYSMPIELVYSPLLYIVNLAKALNLGINITVFIFAILISIGTASLYLLVKNILKLSSLVAITSSTFYLFNLYTQAQIWKRFLYPGIFAWSYLPLYLFFLIKWFEKPNLIYLIFFLLSSSIFTIIFAHPAFVITYIVTALILAMHYFLKDKLNFKKIFIALGKLVIILSLFFLVNSWWFYPFLSFSGSSSIESFVEKDKNYISLLGVSKYANPIDIFLLRQSFWYGKDFPWYDFYNQLPIYFISIGVFLLVIYGIKKSRQLHHWRILILLLVFGWFFSKGTNFPLGDIFFKNLFTILPPAGALRNPYEKFGIVFLLPYAIFFALGLYHLTKKLKPKTQIVTFGTILFLVCGLLVWPMWTGTIFPKEHKIDIPTYYLKANSYLNSLNSNRLLQLPFNEVENLKYSWGFVGEDPSFFLFDRESISRPQHNSPHDDVYNLIPKLASNPDFPKVLGLWGISEVVFHKDQLTTLEKMDTEWKNVQNWRYIEGVKDFDNLSIISFRSEVVRSKIYPALYKSYQYQDDFEKIFVDFLTIDMSQNNLVFVNEKDKLPQSANENLLPEVKIFSKNNIYYEVSIKNAQTPFVLVLSDSYHPQWHAVNPAKNKSYKHIKIFDFFNGWFIDETIDQNIKIYFRTWPWE